MNQNDIKQNASNEQMVSAATNAVVKEKGRKLNLQYATDEQVENFVKECSAKFIEAQINDFPRMCREFRRVNMLKRKFLEDLGTKGGWTDKKTMKHNYEIPRELYLFMQNLVYKDFWSNENKKHSDWFLKNIIAGEAPERLLIAIKQVYGGNKDLSLLY